MKPQNDAPESRLSAVLEIGSTGIRLLIAEITVHGEWKIVDKAVKPVVLGRDVFASGQVSHSSLLECLTVLRNFQELLASWGVSGENVHVIATSAVRAAQNREMFADRVFQETGFRLMVIEGIEENRLMYLAVRFALRPSPHTDKDNALLSQGNAIIIDIGGGSTEIMLLSGGKMVAAHSIRLGSILLDQQSQSGKSKFSWERYLNNHIKNTVNFLQAEMNLSQIKTFVATGADTRIASFLIGDEYNAHSRFIDRNRFFAFVKEIQLYSTEDCVRKLGIGYGDAEGFVPGMLIYKYFLEQTQALLAVVPSISIREGLLIDITRGFDQTLQEEFFSQVIASAVNLGRKYHFDENHGRHVAYLSTMLFDALIKEHGLNRRGRLLLETAALLHDIGTFIRGSSHQKHGQYIVANSEIFGLQHEELEITANVIRYHRGDQPSLNDVDFIALQKEDRIMVFKLSAILRIADSLDTGHSQQIKHITIERRRESLLIHTEGEVDRNFERFGLEEKAGMFQDVFGYKVALV